MFDVAVVVLGVLVEDEAPDIMHGEIAAWPHFGHVERVETEFQRIGLFGLHDLHLGRPLNLLPVFDGFPQLLLGVIGVLARDADGFWLRKLLLTMLCDEVNEK